MRTQEEIVERCQEKVKAFLSFEPEVLVSFLDFEVAKPFLRDDARADDWAKRELVESDMIEAMRSYMAEYGWDKCESHRGISASRTVEKLGCWIWLLGNEQDYLDYEVYSKDHYMPYGAPILKWVCEKYAFPIPQGGGRLDRMMNGEACSPGCSGCSS